MRRSVFAMLGAVALVGGAALYGQTHAQTTGVNVGSLQCKVAGGMGFIFGSSKDIDCLLVRTDGSGRALCRLDQSLRRRHRLHQGSAHRVAGLRAGRDRPGRAGR